MVNVVGVKEEPQATENFSRAFYIKMLYASHLSSVGVDAWPLWVSLHQIPMIDNESLSLWH